MLVCGEEAVAIQSLIGKWTGVNFLMNVVVRRWENWVREVEEDTPKT
jgi:hypothetical protein